MTTTAASSHLGTTCRQNAGESAGLSGCLADRSYYAKTMKQIHGLGGHHERLDDHGPAKELACFFLFIHIDENSKASLFFHSTFLIFGP